MTAATAQPRIEVNASAATAVQAVGLGKIIDDHVILRDINFQIPTGSYVALLGANGAGKTTLLNILSTLIPPSDGQLMMFGQAVGRESSAVRARLGLIGHNTMLYRDLSARENLIFFGRLYGLAEPQARADELLEYVGLASRGDDPVKTYSRGMAQRAAIARALMHDPELLLADEPFAGLDAPSRKMLEHMLAQLNEQGRTIVLASHDIERSLDLAQKMLVLRQGRLVIDRATAELNATTVRRRRDR